MPGIIGSTGWERSSAWIWDFSSTHNTTAASGGSRYRPTTSYTLSTNNGSVDSLNVSTRCGLRPKPRQIRPIVDFDNPDFSAINLRDQCVAFLGVLQGRHHHVLDLVERDRWWPARAVLVDQAVQTPGHKPGAPFAHRRRVHSQIRGDLLCLLYTSDAAD